METYLLLHIHSNMKLRNGLILDNNKKNQYQLRKKV